MMSSTPENAAGSSEAGRNAFDRFRAVVLDDPALQEALREIDAVAFPALAVRFGRDRGFAFTVADVEEAIAAARRAWFERWI